MFTVSALHGDGVEDLNQYLVEKAYPSYGYWEYNQDLLTIKVNVMRVNCLRQHLAIWLVCSCLLTSNCYFFVGSSYACSGSYEKQALGCPAKWCTL